MVASAAGNDREALHLRPRSTRPLYLCDPIHKQAATKAPVHHVGGRSMKSSKQSRQSRLKQKQDAIPFWRDDAGVPPAVFMLSFLVLSGGMLFGGTGGTFGDTIVQLLALPLIVLSAMQWSQKPLLATDWTALALIGGIALLGCAQLLPLPMWFWSELPARADLARDMQSVGIGPGWRSLSLNPYATERALQWTLPAVAMFMAVRWTSLRQLQILMAITCIGAFILLVLAIAENHASQDDVLATANEAIAKAAFAMQTAQAPLPAPEPQSLPGLFSNRNHFATLLAMVIPLVVALGLRVWLFRTKGEPKTWIPWALSLTLVMVALLAGMIETHSRAALVLGPLAILGSLTLLRHLKIKRMVVWSLVLMAVVGALDAFQLAGSKTVARWDTSPQNDLRWDIHATTLDAARHFGPLGSGLGTFVEAYQQVVPVEGYRSRYINHAHSDYHELWLETGIPGALLILGFIAWFVWCSSLAWRTSKHAVKSTLLPRAASLSILLVLLHSYLDYPLRKTALLVLFGLCCALIARASRSAQQDLPDERAIRVTSQQ
jgi:hypothetical protein